MSDKTEWLFRIEDILHSIGRIEKAVEKIGFDEFSADEDLHDIVDRRFQIIGEAARKIPDEIKNRYPDVPWSKMIGLRNFVVHEYSRVDRRLILETARRVLPELKTILRSLLEKERNG